jgi:CIC family chloride channel protein
LLHRADFAGKLIHIVAVDGDRIVGVQRINMSVRQKRGGADAAITLGAIAHRDFTVAREDDIMFDVINRMRRHNASMAIVMRGRRRIPRADDVAGVITKEHVADSVAESVRAYPQGA